MPTASDREKRRRDTPKNRYFIKGVYVWTKDREALQVGGGREAGAQTFLTGGNERPSSVHKQTEGDGITSARRKGPQSRHFLKGKDIEKR